MKIVGSGAESFRGRWTSMDTLAEGEMCCHTEVGKCTECWAGRQEGSWEVLLDLGFDG